MRKLTDRQQNILDIVMQYPGRCTAQINKLDRNRQVYESNTKERLITLKNRGLVFEEPVFSIKSGKLLRRDWYPANKALEVQ